MGLDKSYVLVMGILTAATAFFCILRVFIAIVFELRAAQVPGAGAAVLLLVAVLA